jgi:nicotinamidase-related amidase
VADRPDTAARWRFTRVALVVIDVQRYFVDSLPFAAMGRIVEPIARFLPVARAAGILIAHLRSAFRSDMQDAGRLGSRTRQMMESSQGGSSKARPAPKSWSH